MSGDIPSVPNGPPQQSGATTSTPSSSSSSSSNNTLDLGQAVIVTMPKEVLDTANSAAKAGRILAEVIGQQGNHATLKTPDGAFIIKTDTQLANGQVVMLKLDAEQLQAAARAVPVDTVDMSSATQYNLRMTPTAAVEQTPATPPQQYWRGQLAPVALPDDAMDLLHVMQDVYTPGAPAQRLSATATPALPLPVSEGVAKFFALVQVLREMNMLPPQLADKFLFSDMPPDDASMLTPQAMSKLGQSLQDLTSKLNETLMPTAQKATEQAGQWLKSKLPQNVLGQIDQLKDTLQKNLQGLQIQPQQQQLGMQPISFMLPPGSSLLQVWQSAIQGYGGSIGKAPFLLLNMLGLQRPGEGSGLAQLMPQFKQLTQQNTASPVIPTLVLPGEAPRNPVLLSPYGLLFSQGSHVVEGKAPLLPGTVIFWSPVTNPTATPLATPLASLPLWPEDGSIPQSVFEWPELEKIFLNRTSDSMMAGPVQQAIQNLIPNMAQPGQLGGAILLMLHALNRGSVGGWIGDRTADLFRNEGKQDILARLVGDFATMASRVMDQQNPEIQRFVLPMVLHEQMAKMVWQVRRDYPEGQNNAGDEQERKKNTRTHFTVDVPTQTLGDLHVQGTVWKQQLDLNLKTAHPLNETMQNGIRERFHTALQITGMHGQIIFGV